MDKQREERGRAGTLNNNNTRFGKFRWGEDPRIRKALEALGREIGPQPIRLKFKLGKDVR